MNAEAEISNLKFRLDMLEQQLQKAVAENSALKKQHEEDQKTILKLQQENRNLHDSVDYLTFSWRLSGFLQAFARAKP